MSTKVRANILKMAFAKMRGRWRFLWGFCPACNSDAPGQDSCPVCRAGFRYRHEGAGQNDGARWRRFVDFIDAAYR